MIEKQLELIPAPCEEAPVVRVEEEPQDNGMSIISACLPRNILAILERRARNHQAGISGYVRDRLVYDLTRNHHGRSE